MSRDKEEQQPKKGILRSVHAVAMKSYETYITGLYKIADELYMNITELNPARLASFKAHYKDAQLFRDRYHEAFNAFMAECSDERQQDEANAKFNKYNEVYYSIEVMRDSIVEQTAQVPETSKPKSAQFCLPKINLGTFSGAYTEWPNFIALFDSLIHQNQDLNDIQKMHYLLSILEKEPLNLIKHLPLSEQNYNVARTLLRDRYENKRLIADKHLESILNIATLNQQNTNGLRKLVNTLKENMQALTALGFDVKSWSFVMLHIISKKLPSELRSRFELSLSSSPQDIPSFDTLLSFLENQLRVWETVGVSKGFSGSSGTATNPTKSTLTVSTFVCCICKGEHSVYNCDKLNAMTPGQRREVVIKSELCFNCLRPHFVKKCLSRSLCSICQGRHHTKLHIEQQQEQGISNPAPQVSGTAVSTFGSTVQSRSEHSAHLESTMLLGTALVGVQDINGHDHTARALLDSGSQVSIMTENLAQKLRLTRSNSGALFGLGGSNSQRTNGRVQCVIKSLHDKSHTPLITSAVVVKRITGSLPSIRVSSAVEEKCRDTLLPLADDKFSVPGPIDLLIGVDLYNEIFDGKRQSLGQGLPTAHSSLLGWVLLGRAPVEHQMLTCRDVSLHSAVDLDGMLTRFWETEEPPSPRIKDPEDLLCERHFVDTHSRDDTGRFIVRLPFRAIRKPLGNTQASALKRFYNLERKLLKSDQLKERYTAFMADYLEAGHMRPVSSDSSEGRYYIPHHGVLNENSSSTKLRAVFDASAPSSSGISLNQVLMPGPKLQHNIEDIVLRFRTHAVVFTCDIKQMYRQIRLHEDDCKYQTIFWRDSINKPLQQFELTTVTYGVSSSAYLAMRVVHELAVLNEATHPEGARALKEDTFVDDVVTGSSDVESARDLQRQIVEVLGQGRLAVRKWVSNNKEILKDYPTDHLELPFRFNESGDKVFKVLGVEWNAECDHFMFRTGTLSPCSTKRQILSNIAQVYDPCGYLAPVILYAKLIMQQLWLRTDLSWDDTLPQELCDSWDSFAAGFDVLRHPQFPRFIFSKDPVRVDILGFSDASERAFGAVVYLRVEDCSGEVGVHLLLAKTKVAPTRQRRTIPQLELCGAVLLVGLICRVREILQRRIKIDSTVAWCDSTVVLHWLRTPPHKLKTFEGNRVSQIQGLGSYISWRYVPTALNPADCASRGLLPQEIVEHNLWWSPDWLKEDPDAWPENLVVDPENQELNVAHAGTTPSIRINHEDVAPCPIIARYSSLTKLQHVIAWSLRFAFNARHQTQQRKQGSLSVEELEGALHRAIKLVQEEVFLGHFQALKAKRALKDVAMARLQPFIDPEGLLRVGGRLKHSNLPFQVKHPILLPKAHHLTNIIIDYHHKLHLHAGASCLTTILRQRFWIVSARRVVRHRIFQCRRCSQLKAKPLEPIMGNLPPARVRQARPFLKVGIDFAGPFNIKVSTVRNAKIRKAYVCIFVCLVVKAIHIEVTSDLSTEAFLACFQRFVSRRGTVSDVYTDCGKNFQGGKRYLSEAETFMRQNNTELSAGLRHLNVSWHMNPPYSPHMGGIWESAVKSAKQLFRRTIGDQILSFEELTTIFTRIEAVLNSRPLCGSSDDPISLDPLTPGHFLIGQPLVSPPEFCFEHTPISRLNRWQLVRQISQHFWRRWQLEYLTLLQQRAKWTKGIPNLQVGDLVLIKEDNLPPLQWRSGRVSELHPGSDGVVRVVKLKTSAGSCLRSVSKVCPLPKSDTEAQL